MSRLREYVSLFIFAISILFLKLLIRHIYMITVGSPFALQGTDELILLYLFGYSSDPVIIQGFDDVFYHYYFYVDYYVKGWNPYESSGLIGDNISGYYNYGPLYIMIISAGSQLGLSYLDSILFSNLIFDTLSVVVIFKLVKREFPGFEYFASIAYALSPLSLLFLDIYLLNMPQVIFFMLLFVYYEKEHPDLSMASLGIAFAIKLFPITILPISLVYQFKREGIKRMIKSGITFTVYGILPFIPFLLTDSDAVIERLLNVGRTDSFFIDNWLFLLLIILLSGFSIVFNELQDYKFYLKTLTFYIIALHFTFKPLAIRLFKYYYTLILAFLIITHIPKSKSWKNIITYLFSIYIINIIILQLPPHGYISFKTMRWLLTIVYAIYNLYELHKLVNSRTKEN